MIVGMGLIVGGVGVAAYGLLPKHSGLLSASQEIVVLASRGCAAFQGALDADGGAGDRPDHRHHEARQPRLHHPRHDRRIWRSKATASLVPFFALVGTVVGSIVWGIIADIYGRKASILLSAVMFVGTSICGAMPSLYWNVGMCFMMGAAAGGMLPVTYALLAEMMPSKHRGWSAGSRRRAWFGGRLFRCQRLLGASAARVRLADPVAPQPADGPVAGAAGRLLPESAKFLLARGRREEAQRVMERFGSQARSTRPCRRR